MARHCRILVDTLGSETNAQLIVDGAIEFSRSNPDCQVAFVGHPRIWKRQNLHFPIRISALIFVKQSESLERLRSETSSIMKLR